MSLSSQSSSAISPTGASGGGQSLQQLFDFLKNSNISDWQRELDGTATELAARQEESESGRRKLVEQSKDFRQVASEEVRKSVAPLFKSFQTEVDNLSRRSRLAEAAFLAVYKRIIEIPDLYPLYDHIQSLNKRVQRFTDLEIENKQVRETLDQYNNELGEVRNQEYTIRSLKEKIKQLEDNLETKIQVGLREREGELTRKFSDKEREADEAVQDAVRRQLETEHRCQTLQSSLSSAQTELLEAKNKLDERSAAQSSEMEMLLGELDKTNERAASAEMEVVRLREQLRASQSSSHTDQGEDEEGESNKLRNELCSRESEISRLLEDVHRLQSSLNALRVTTAEQARNHERELTNKSAQLNEIEQRLKDQNDYEEIKRELDILKSIEFGGTQSAGEESKLNQPVELLFAEKNKSLQSTVVQLRTHNEQLQRQLSAAMKRNQQQQKVVAAAAAAKTTSLNGNAKPANTNNGAWSSISSPASGMRDASSPPASSTGANSNAYPPSLHSRSSNGVTNLSMKREPVLHDFSAASPQSPATGAMNLSASIATPSTFAQQWQNFTPVAGEELDTCTLAQQVREMLLANSIGQRLFAKHVLNLSQGTVSELLSKPKPWRKLTEKGKESYRRMAVWMSNPNCLQELKDLAPRKGPPGNTTFTKPVEDVETEQKISKILEEAREEMMKEQDGSEFDGQNGSSTSKSLANLCLPSSLSNAQQSDLSDQQKSLRDIARYVAGVQRQELVKLMEAAEKNGNNGQQAVYSEEISKLDERIRMIDTMPADVLTSLGLQSPAGTQNTAPRVTPSPFNQNRTSSLMGGHKSAALTSLANKLKPGKVMSPTTKPFDLSVSSSGNYFDSQEASSTPLPAHQSGNNFGKSMAFSSAAQSIAAVSSNAFHKPNLPPVSQDDFDKYAELSTELLVKRVKNLLAQYGISQRVFGEQTLGLSQGSVSDMLSRPKPWNQLTNKGREPFIRMAIFLDDPHAIHKLARKECSQCHTSPFQPLSNNNTNSMFEPSATSSPSAQSPAVDEPISMLSSFGIKRSLSPPPGFSAPKRQSLGVKSSTLSPSNNPMGAVGFDLRAAFELNTEAVAQQVKDVLSQFGVGQKVFAEQVLGMSQGSVSDLLNRPKPWGQLTLKGREPYIRMFLWLYDPILANQLLPPPKRLLDAAASSGSTAPLEPFVLPGLGNETSQNIVLSALVAPKDPGDGRPPLSAQEQMSSFFGWLQDQQLLQKAAQGSSVFNSNFTIPSSSLSSSSSFDHGSTPPPAHFLNRSSSMSNSCTNLSTNGGSRVPSARAEPIDYSEMPTAFATDLSQPSQPSPPLAEGEPAPQPAALICRSSKRKSANPSKRVTNSPLPTTEEMQNGNAWNNAGTSNSEDDGNGDSKFPDLCRSPSTSSEPRQDDAVERLKRGLASQSDMQWGDGDEEMPSAAGHDQLDRGLAVKEAVGVCGGASLNKAESLCAELTNSIAQKTKDIEHLEEDLRKVNATSSPTVETSIPLGDQYSGRPDDSTQLDSQAAANLLPVVQKQRDRFRVHSQELETQLLSKQQAIQYLEAELNQSRQDNVAMYEKVKFLQSRSATASSQQRGDVESRYSSEYNERLDPFNRFRLTERANSYQQLRPHEKITLGFSRLVLKNAAARTIAFFYAIGLHLLIFLCLYKMSYDSEAKRQLVFECQERYMEHMYKVHGEKQ